MDSLGAAGRRRVEAAGSAADRGAPGGGRRVTRRRGARLQLPALDWPWRTSDAWRGAVVEVFCRVDEDVAWERYEARVGSRHPGHFDEERLRATSPGMTRCPSPSPEGGRCWRWTPPDAVDIDEVVAVRAGRHRLTAA